MNKDLLFLCHRIPYPPNKGDKVRSFNILKQLARDYRVHLGAFIDDEADWRYVDEVARHCGETCFLRVDARRARLRSLPYLLSRRPLSLPYYRDAAMARWVSGMLARFDMARVFVYSGAMAQYVCGRKYSRLHRVIDLVDVDSEKWRQYAARHRWPMSWVYRREGETLLAFERRVAAAFDATVLVSGAEADLFKKLAPEARHVEGIHNGVDTDYFSPARDYTNPYPLAGEPIVFTGAMDYWANVDAVSWFARDILPRVVAKRPEARFYIVGARPSPAVLDLRRLSGVMVVGAVHDIRPYLAHARVVVAPLRIARGIQNKVLEAMAMARPVVATPDALDGLHVEAGREVAAAGRAAGFAAAVTKILAAADSDSMGAQARHRVEEDYSWEQNLQRLKTLLEAAG
ncbi:MAG TPA: TIGR03087 family PEP-CTERM/XrtA system glycosyltransferase [Gammaproteobacteria bacterium]|nr:TIGR03087 family PEP-CTERM/XrtA system glycosyltransferase [Gammaproteobacteria bacterium]